MYKYEWYAICLHDSTGNRQNFAYISCPYSMLDTPSWKS
jgi:hypothetical protein